LAQIEIIDINKIYRAGDSEIKAVDNVTLKIEKGEFISITGHSGSGKTTLLSIIGGVLRPTSGKVLFENNDIYSLDKNDLSEYRCKRIGFIFQFASLLPVLTAKENLLLPTVFNSDKKNNVKEKALGYLNLVGLGDKIDSYPSELSGGQQRRIAIARALMNDPEIILADEPTGDLDEETEAEIMEFFKKINKEKGITFILVTHSSELAKDAKKRMKMNHGKLLHV